MLPFEISKSQKKSCPPPLPNPGYAPDYKLHVYMIRN